MEKKDRNLHRMFYQVNDALLNMCRISESKRKAKSLNSKNPEVKNGDRSLFHEEIFSFRTFRVYRNACFTFLKWCNSLYPSIRHYTLCRRYVGPYLKDCRNRGLSIKTTSNYRAALVKLYGFSPKDFNIGKLYGKTVSVDDFCKYRFASKDNRNWFRYEQMTTFITCTGLRRNEIRNLNGNMLTNRNGDYCIHVTVGSKGGRERYARIIGTESEKRRIIEMMNGAGEDRVFRDLPDRFSYHVLRSIYACRYIDLVTPDVSKIPGKYRYCFKGEISGFCVDRRTMKEVSQSLGHNRIGVIRNYFRGCLFRNTLGKSGMQITEEVYALLQEGKKFA